MHNTIKALPISILIVFCAHTQGTNIPNSKHSLCWKVIEVAFYNYIYSKTQQLALSNCLTAIQDTLARLEYGQTQGNQKRTSSGQSNGQEDKDTSGSLTRVSSESDHSSSNKENDADEDPPEDQPSKYGPDFSSNYKFQYFNPDRFEKDLDVIAETTEALNTFLVLSFDIDGTVFQNRFESGLSEAEYDDFKKEQKYISSIFKEWIENGKGKNRILLIYNTARFAPNYELLFWTDNAKNWFLPEGHIIIYGNGNFIHLREIPFLLTTQLSQPLIHKMKRRFEAFCEQDNSIHANYETAVSEIRLYTSQTSQEMATLHLPTKLSFEADDDEEDISKESSKYQTLTKNLLKVVHSQNSTKYLYQHTRPPQMLYYFDILHNKGSALTLFMQHLNMHAGYSTIQLYTAGEDIPDIPMLYMDKQATAFWNKAPLTAPALFIEDLEGDPDANYLEREYQSFGVDTYSLRQIQHQWQASVIPNRFKARLKELLKHQKLYHHPKILKASDPGLQGIIRSIRKHHQKHSKASSGAFESINNAQ